MVQNIPDIFVSNINKMAPNEPPIVAQNIPTLRHRLARCLGSVLDASEDSPRGVALLGLLGRVAWKACELRSRA